MKTRSLATAVLTIIGLPLALHATPGEDPVRCDALAQRSLLQRAEVIQIECIDRCTRHGTARLSRMRPPEMTDIAWVFTQIGRCADVCVARFDTIMAYHEAACGAASGYPCMATLSRCDADHMRCRYRCARREFRRPSLDRAACDSTCDARYDDRVAETLAQSMCGMDSADHTN